RAVINDNLLAPLVCQSFCDQSRQHVGVTTRRERHDEADRPLGKCSRKRRHVKETHAENAEEDERSNHGQNILLFCIHTREARSEPRAVLKEGTAALDGVDDSMPSNSLSTLEQIGDEGKDSAFQFSRALAHLHNTW